jgi:hypothetical protein
VKVASAIDRDIVSVNVAVEDTVGVVKEPTPSNPPNPVRVVVINPAVMEFSSFAVPIESTVKTGNDMGVGVSHPTRTDTDGGEKSKATLVCPIINTGS